MIMSMREIQPPLFNMKRLLFLMSLGLLPFYGLGADYEPAVNDLIPKLADANVPARYSAQMELQAIASNSSAPGHEAERAALGKVLAAKVSDASVPQPARVWITRQLEYMGGAEAVQALTRNLNGDDAELRECARRALEKNSSPTASASLRAPLEKGGVANWKIGLINALGQRGDGAAVNLIAPQMSDSTTAGAAALALGRIANPAAVAALLAAPAGNSAVGEALMLAANRLQATGEVNGAKAIYMKLYAPGNPVASRAAALAGLTVAEPGAAAQYITEALASSEPRLQQVAIQCAAKAGKGLGRLLEARFPQLAASAKAQVLAILDATSERLILEAVVDQDALVRQAAIEALGRAGGRASVPVLINLALSDSREDKNLAETALVKISGPGALAALEKNSTEGTPKSRIAAMNALAARSDKAAIPGLVKSMNDSDTGVAQGALAALGKLGSDNEVEILGRLALTTPSSDVSAALEQVASRAKDQTAAARKLLALAAGNEAAVAALVNTLSVLGGKEAMAATLRLAASSNPDIQENAIRSLGNWPDFAAAKPLLEIAVNPNTKEKSYILALQGVVRLVKSADNEPAQSRAEAALAALAAGRRDEEKKLAISALAAVPHPQTVAAIKGLLSDPKFKIEAGLGGLNLADLLFDTDPAAAKALAGALKEANISMQISRRADAILRR